MEKEIWQEYGSLLQEIRLLEQEKQRLADGVLSAVRISDLPKGMQIGDDTGEIASRLVDLAGLIAAKLNAAITLRLKLEEKLDGLTPTERVLMRLRYLEGWPWDRVAKEMHYSVQHIWRLHAKILQKLQQESA